MKSNNIIILCKPKKNKNYIVTIAIGKKYFLRWKKFAFPSWQSYCKKHDLGLLVFTNDLLSKNDPKWKKPTWQKLLIGSRILDHNLKIENVCYLDSDTLINYFTAPDVFKKYIQKNIGLVSHWKNLPYSHHEVMRRIAFNRHYYYSNQYPLDSSIFMTPKQIFRYHKLKAFDDYACMGFIIFNVKNHSQIMEKWFYKYKSNVKTLTGGGDEPILNYEFLNYNKISWLDFKFQVMWLLEIAWKYPFLYRLKKKQSDIIIDCIEASLSTSFFLHFAGSWYESNMWLHKKIYNSKNKIQYNNKFKKFLDLRVTAKATKRSLPNK